jgi:rhodanese-related sulfurtransferase
MVTVDQLRKMCDCVTTQLVDVRSPAEFATGHVPGAVNIPMEQVEARLGDLRDDSAVVLICQAGTRARAVAEWLRPVRDNVFVLVGGAAAWCNAGHPMVKCVNTRWSLERQVRLGAGLLILIGTGLALGISQYWLGLTAFVGLGLTVAGLTGFCPMGIVLSKMPWNRASSSACRKAEGIKLVTGPDETCRATGTGQQ